MPILDIFNPDANAGAFSTTTLTDVVNELKYRPSRVGELGLFNDTPVSTISVAIERVGDILQVIKPTPRGAPGEARDMPKRNLLSVGVPHFPRPWSVLADEVQGLRALGSETEIKPFQRLVAEKMAANMGDFALTEEQARLGAITGIVTYADGTTLDLYAIFNVPVPTEINFDLANASPADGALRKACTGVIRAMKKALGAIYFDSVHAFCGDAFFDALLAHKEVRATYVNWDEAQILRQSYVGPNRSTNPMFEFGGIVFENYGEIDGEGIGIATDKCRFFPMGVTNLFRTYYAPADYMETVNTLGQRLYAKQERMDFDRGIMGEMQMNALQLCTRPKTLLSARRT